MKHSKQIFPLSKRCRDAFAVRTAVMLSADCNAKCNPFRLWPPLPGRAFAERIQMDSIKMILLQCRSAWLFNYLSLNLGALA